MSVLWIYLVIMFVCLVLVQGAEKRCPTLKLEGGRVRYKNKKIIATFTCNNGYTRYGSELAVCNQGHWSVPTPQCVGTLCTKPSVDPPVIIESFMNGGLLQFFCKPGFVRVGPERIYCKLSDWNLKPPTCTVGVSEGCDFEDGFCGWSDDLTDSFDWTRNKGDTPTADTGPMVDHTSNNTNGHYIFIESSAPQSNGSKARFLSPFYSPESLDNKCLEFYYHMLGDHNVGILEVLLRPMKIPTEALNSDHQIFYKKGNQGDKWIKASVMIPEVTEPTQIVFQGTVSGWLGDIALDDISVTSCDTATAATQTVPSARLTSQTTQHANTAQPVTTMQSGPKTTTSTDTPRVTKPSTSATSVTLTTTMVSKITSKAPTSAVKTATSAKTTTLSKVSTTAVKASTADVKTTAAATVKTTAATVKTTAATVKTTTAATVKTTKSTAASQPVQTTLKSSLPIRISTTATLSTTRKPTTESTSRTKAATEVYRAETTPAITYQTSVSYESTAPRDTKVDQTSAMWSSTYMTASSKTTFTPDEGASKYQTSHQAVVSDITTNKDFVGEATKTTHEAETTNEDFNDYNTGDGGSDNKNTSDGEEPGDDNDDNDDTEPEETTSPISDSRDNDTSEDSSVYSNGNMNSDMLTPQDNDGSNAASGKVHGSDETSGTKELLPLIIGVVSAVVVGAVVIGILTWRWSKNQRMKQQKEEDDQMNIITEYVETNLNV